jgi:hypothetical protein
MMKGGVTGKVLCVSVVLLFAFVVDFALRWKHRAALGVDDFERAAALLKAARGKRLTYRPTPDERA